MKRITVKLATHNGGWEVEAAEVAPGIALHRAIGAGNLPLKQWSLTHVASGMRITGPFDRRRQAVACALALGQVTDWTQSSKTLLRVRDLGRAVRDAHAAALLT